MCEPTKPAPPMTRMRESSIAGIRMVIATAPAAKRCARGACQNGRRELRLAFRGLHGGVLSGDRGRRARAVRVRAVRHRRERPARAVAPRRRLLGPPRGRAGARRGRAGRAVDVLRVAAQRPLQRCSSRPSTTACARSPRSVTGSACTSTPASTPTARSTSGRRGRAVSWPRRSRSRWRPCRCTTRRCRAPRPSMPRCWAAWCTPARAACATRYAYVSDSNGYWRFERLAGGAGGRRARAAARAHAPRVVAGGADEPARADPALHRRAAAARRRRPTTRCCPTTGASTSGCRTSPLRSAWMIDSPCGASKS